jgi:HK97 family phage prohead protease
MDVVTKATGTVTPVNDSTSKHGEFDVILSTKALDRDGDELHPDEWMQPLPDKINFDSDHGMSVATCVGSGKPFINDEGQLQVRGTFASTPHGQAVRALVKEGHIDSVSVAFRPVKNQKNGKPCRELLNGAFVAVPANPEAKVLEVKEAKEEAFTPEQVARIEKCVEDVIRKAANYEPSNMEAVSDMFMNDSLDDDANQHKDCDYELRCGVHQIAVKLGNGMPYSDPTATPGVLAPSNRSLPSESAETKAETTASTASPDDVARAKALMVQLGLTGI